MTVPLEAAEYQDFGLFEKKIKVVSFLKNFLLVLGAICQELGHRLPSIFFRFNLATLQVEFFMEVGSNN